MTPLIGLVLAGIGAFVAGRAAGDEVPGLFALGLVPLLYGLYLIYEPILMT